MRLIFDGFGRWSRLLRSLRNEGREVLGVEEIKGTWWIVILGGLLRGKT